MLKQTCIFRMLEEEEDWDDILPRPCNSSSMPLPIIEIKNKHNN